jgi:fructose-specific phosphotransferase system component IIB
MASDDNNKKDEKSGEKNLGDTLKKVFTAGVSAAFMTEESLRSYLAELKLPKEILSVIIQGASKAQGDITQRVTKEAVGIIQKIDFVKEFSKFAETHKFKISAEIDIVKKDKTDKDQA